MKEPSDLGNDHNKGSIIVSEACRQFHLGFDLFRGTR